jgi:hypothetical protein
MVIDYIMEIKQKLKNLGMIYNLWNLYDNVQ